jgi:hypothetical protein
LPLRGLPPALVGRGRLVGLGRGGLGIILLADDGHLVRRP